MSEPTDIKALDEYLQRSSDVSQRYRELGSDEVPPELDRRVLAAARDAVANEGTQRSRSWLRWSAPVALAASVVLVVTVVLERGVQDQTVSLPQSTAEVQQVGGNVVVEDKTANAGEAPKLQEQPAPQPVAPAAVPPPSEERRSDVLAKQVVQPERSVAAAPAEKLEAHSMRDQRQAAPPPASIAPQEPALPAASPAQASEPPAANASLARGEEEADASHDISEVAVTGRAGHVSGRVGPRNTVSNSSFIAGRPVADEQRERSDPQAWLEDIRVMRRAGKNVEADREWQRFRAAFPTFQVADDDIARAQEPERK